MYWRKIILKQVLETIQAASQAALSSLIIAICCRGLFPDIMILRITAKHWVGFGEQELGLGETRSGGLEAAAILQVQSCLGFTILKLH